MSGSKRHTRWPHATESGNELSSAAVQAMKAADQGVYCGPLRLLAMEIYDECNAEGTFCDLITGASIEPNARHEQS